MRVRWRGLELPRRVYRGEGEQTDFYAEFVVEPFEAGFGTTIGNSLRRVLLSSLEGAAITTVKIEGVAHEFTSMEGVMEDITDVVLNIKGIVLRYDGEGPATMTVQRTSAGEVLAGDIQVDPSVEIVNKDHVIATLTADVAFRAEFSVETGRGYRTASDNRTADQEVGVIPVNSIFSPVRRVRYRTENVRVGQLTNYDRLILEVWTDGTVKPDDALVEAGLILRKHLNPFVQYHEMGSASIDELYSPAERTSSVSSGQDEVLDRPVSTLNLSVRSGNCLDAARITTIRELVSLTEADLLRFRSFGKTSLVEVNEALVELGLSLGEAALGSETYAAMVGMETTGMDTDVAATDLSSAEIPAASEPPVATIDSFTSAIPPVATEQSTMPPVTTEQPPMPASPFVMPSSEVAETPPEPTTGQNPEPDQGPQSESGTIPAGSQDN